MISGKSKDIFKFVSPFSTEIKCTQNVLQRCPKFSIIYYPPSPGWILGGLVVPDTLTGGCWWPGGATFQISGV